MMRKLLKFGFYVVYPIVSAIWRQFERLASWKEIRFWIDNVPGGVYKGVSFDGYTQWIHQQGFFSGLFACYLRGGNNHILDFGCGMGKLAPVALPFIKDGGKFLGVDTHQISIDWCKRTYQTLPNCEFYLTRDSNAFYTNSTSQANAASIVDWPVGTDTQDLLIAHSVFTHMQETESKKYMDKVVQVLRPGALAIISFHIVRKYTNTNIFLNFEHALTPGWFTGDPACPEHAIGVTEEAVHKLLAGRFKILRWLEGASTGGRGPSFQDIFILQKL